MLSKQRIYKIFTRTGAVGGQVLQYQERRRQDPNALKTNFYFFSLEAIFLVSGEQAPRTLAATPIKQ
jgi:hypothetical protein